MSLSSLKGSVGVGIQAAKGTPATTFAYFPTLNANVTGEQMAQNLPPEVGGTYFSRGAYKAGLRARGELAMIPRPDSVGWLLRSLFNAESQAISTDVDAAAVLLHDHVFTVGDTAAHPHKWLTVRRSVSGAYGEQMSDARVGSFRIEAAAAGVVQTSVQLLGGLHSEIPGEDVMAEDGPVFLTCSADVTEGGAPFIVDRISVEAGAQLSDNEFRVGSYYLDDITLLQRAVTIQADVRIKARDLVAKVYRNNAAAPAAGTLGAWSPVLYRSGIVLEFRTAEVVPQILRIEMPGVDFLTLPVQLSGAEIVRAQLSASVTLDVDNFDAADADSATLQPIKITLRNARTTLYA
jgi:hypothetical protein